MAPPFLVKFVRELRQRHVLASPEIVRGWINQLEAYSQQLVSEVEILQSSPLTTADEPIQMLLSDVDYTFNEIVRIVHSNCERIASEVADFRAAEDVAKIRSRLARLITLHEKYLQPVIKLVDINGAFYYVAERIAQACETLASHKTAVGGSVQLQATSVRQLVVWLRMVVIRQAEEAKRELAPLCVAAAQEHQIAKGVNRGLGFARRGDWELLDIPSELRIMDDKNRHLFSDLAAERYILDVKQFKVTPPPVVQLEPPVEIAAETTASDIVEQLEEIGSSDDILKCVLQNESEASLEKAIQLLHDVIERAPNNAIAADEVKTYSRNTFEAETHRWVWRRRDYDN